MSQVHVRRVRKLDDATVIEVLNSLRTILEDYSPTITASQIRGLDIPLDDYGTYSKIGRYSLQYASCSCSVEQGSLQVTFDRDLIDVHGQRQSSAEHDEFRFIFHPNIQAWSGKQDLVNRLIGCLDPIYRPLDDTSALPEEANLRNLMGGFADTYRQMLASLSNKIEEVEAAKIELETRFQQKEDERINLHKAALTDLEEKRKQLELQSHMSERRRLQRELSKQAQEATLDYRLPAGAKWMRWAVFFAALMFAGLAGWFSYSSFAKLTASQASTVDWILLARGILGSILSLGATAYAATWMRRFYEADIEAARAMGRFQHDLNRASWVIEAVLEIQQEKKGTVPAQWLDGVTRGLFDNSGRSSSVDEGAQALGALLGYSASASFGPDGAKFDLGRSGARKLAASARAAQDE